jgi:hypothetical protein
MAVSDIFPDLTGKFNTIRVHMQPDEQEATNSLFFVTLTDERACRIMTKNTPPTPP